MAVARSKRMDPRLRRLVEHVDAGQKEELVRAKDRGLVAEDAAAVLYKRVLVKLFSDAIPTALAHLEWNKIVDEIYSVNVPVASWRRWPPRPACSSCRAGTWSATTSTPRGPRRGPTACRRVFLRSTARAWWWGSSTSAATSCSTTSADARRAARASRSSGTSR